MKTFLLLLCAFAALLPFGFAQDAITTPTTPSTLSYFTQVPPSTTPCPCFGQPEGIVIPHPSDCRAYYTCTGGLEVRQSKCTDQDQFFHPYIRSCVKRNTFVSFVPDFIPTKDLCKISSVFRAPAMENFESCIIKSDETVVDANSDEYLSLTKGSNKNIPASTTIPAGLGGILNLFPWTSNRNEMSENTIDPRIPSTFTPYQTYTTEMPTRMETEKIPKFTPSSSKTETNCKVAKVIVHHFPGPCKADITCENGAMLFIDKCQSSLNVVPL